MANIREGHMMHSPKFFKDCREDYLEKKNTGSQFFYITLNSGSIREHGVIQFLQVREPF